MFETYHHIVNGAHDPRQIFAKRLLIDRPAETSSLEGLLELHREFSGIFCRNYPTAGTEGPDGNAFSLYDLKTMIAGMMLESCMLCENRCAIDRKSGYVGECGVGWESLYASEFLHMGEESVLIPSHTIFFTGCTFRCVHCQNWDIANQPESGHIFDESIIELIRRRHREGARNINLVGGNPDEHLYNILKVFRKLDVPLPIVWNSNTYASSETMELLRGFADLHLADFKYGSDACAKEISGINNYWQVVTRNLSFAYKNSEILIRHLVLPGHTECCTVPVAKWCAENIPDCGFNLMFQYHPAHQAHKHPQLKRLLNEDDVIGAMNAVKNLPLNLV